VAAVLSRVRWGKATDGDLVMTLVDVCAINGVLKPRGDVTKVIVLYSSKVKILPFPCYTVLKYKVGGIGQCKGDKDTWQKYLEKRRRPLYTADPEAASGFHRHENVQ